MELRSIQRRNRDETVSARENGYPMQRPSYGYMFVRLSPTARIDHVAIDEVAAEVIREVARRILADETGDITYNTEAARLNREAVPAPSDRRAELYARKPKGHVWTGKTVQHILTSEAALGYLMHGGRPVIGKDGKPTRIAEPLWDRPTHEALCAKTAPKRAGSHAPQGTQLLSGRSACGNCGARLYLSGKRKDGQCAYGCTGRVRGLKQSAECKPAPSIGVTELDAQVSEWFLARYGAGEVMRKVFDPGTGHAAQIAEATAARKRLKSDRDAGLYDDPDEEAWYRARYQEMTEEIKALRALPERKPGMIEISTGRTIAQEWLAADTARRREMLAEFDVRVVINARKTGPGNLHQISEKKPRVTITGVPAPATHMMEKAA